MDDNKKLHADNPMFYATGSTQYRYYGSMPIGEILSTCIAEMLPLEGKVIGVDPMKRQYQMPTVSCGFYIVPVCQVAENSQYRSLVVGEGGDPMNMTIAQMWQIEGKAIGRDPMKIQYQNVQDITFVLFHHFWTQGGGNQSIWAIASMPCAEAHYMTIPPMCPRKGEVIGVDPVKCQYQMPITLRSFYTLLVCQVAENSPYRSLLIGEEGNPFNKTIL